MGSLNTNKKVTAALIYTALAAGAVLMIFPFLWMLLTSFKTIGESMRIPLWHFPQQQDMRLPN